MKGSSCIKKDAYPRLEQRKVTWPCSVKYRGSRYSNPALKQHEGTNVFVEKVRAGLRVVDARKKLVCVVDEESSIKLPPPEKKVAVRKCSAPKKKQREDLSDKNLFELTLLSYIPQEVFREIKDRLERTRDLLNGGYVSLARSVIDSLLSSPQKPGRAG